MYFLLTNSGCFCLSFPSSSAAKESTCNAGDHSSILRLGRSTREGIGYPLQYSWASLVAQPVKNPPAVCETWVQSLGEKIPWRREWLPTLAFLPGEFHGIVPCIVHGVTKSWTQLSDFHFHFCWVLSLVSLIGSRTCWNFSFGFPQGVHNRGLPLNPTITASPFLDKVKSLVWLAVVHFTCPTIPSLPHSCRVFTFHHPSN